MENKKCIVIKRNMNRNYCLILAGEVSDEGRGYKRPKVHELMRHQHF